MKKLLVSLLMVCGFSAQAGEMKEYIVRSEGHQVISLMGTWNLNARKVKYFDNTVVTSLTAEQAQALAKRGYSVQENGRYTIQVTGYRPLEMASQEAKDLWGYKAVKADLANQLPQGSGEGITVCVVDTGVDGTHPDLEGQVVGGESFVAGEADWMDGNGHGTHVAGTIAGKGLGVLGVASKAKIYASRVLGSDGSGTYEAVASGIKACIGKAQVINMSLGGSRNAPIVEEAVNEALKAGLIVVAAAGNNYGKVGYPAAQKGVIAISAIDVKLKLAAFSSRGPEIAFAAPGVDIISSIPGGKYASFDGTSMASPHAAGVVAIMLSSGKKQLQAEDIKLVKEHQGAGLVDAYKTAK